ERMVTIVCLIAAAGCVQLVDPLPAVATGDERAAAAAVIAAGPSLSARPAPEWSALFDRSSGWTGGDAITSIPLSGVEAPGTATKTLFLFNDTPIGTVRPDGSRSPNTVLVHNTLVGLAGRQPLPSRAQFYWATDDTGKAISVFRPSTPN